MPYNNTYVMQKITMLQLDMETSRNLRLIADAENRTKVDELRFLVKERAKEIGVKIK